VSHIPPPQTLNDFVDCKRLQFAPTIPGIVFDALGESKIGALVP